MTEQEQAELDAYIQEVRENPLAWFHRHGYWLNEETRAPTRGPANVLQRRMFAHYKYCQDNGLPCRMAVLKYRRAGSSTASQAMNYFYMLNHNARMGVIGMDYRSSANMMEMLSHFGSHDDFPGWSASFKAEKEIVPWSWEDKLEKEIATKLMFKHGSRCELYTAENEKAARSAGLQGYTATECAFWPMGGVRDAGQTLLAMRNTLPKKGFHLCIEESTANGAMGAFYETCKGARWPEHATWWKRWETNWQLTANRFGKDLQPVLIFAAWFEDERHVPEHPVSDDDITYIQDTLDEDEKALIKLYGEEGPKGQRLGSEVNATVWEQLAWRRGIIASVCKKGGATEFKQEYPSSPLESFRSTGSPVFDEDGMVAIELRCREVTPEPGMLTTHRDGGAAWIRCDPKAAAFQRWEDPIFGARYLVVVDPMSGEEEISGSDEKDRHSVLAFRDAMKLQDNARLRFLPPRLVARIIPPCEFDTTPLARLIWLLSLHYGDCPIVIEKNAGIHLIKTLYDEPYNANLYRREEFDKVRQRSTHQLGWLTNEATRRLVVQTMQGMVREQTLDVACPHLAAEMRSFVTNKAGKAVGGGSSHDDDVIAAAIGLTCLPHATEYTRKTAKIKGPADDHVWKSY